MAPPPTGSDGNPGTLAQPFATLQKAADSEGPGDTVIVQDGVYSDSIAGGAIVTLNRGGVAGNWVWFKAQHPGAAKLDGQNNTSATGFKFASGAGYVRIEGFEIFGTGADGSGDAIECYGGGHDVQIIGNDIHDIGRLCSDSANCVGCGIFVEQPNVVIEANRIHDLGRYSPGENGCAPSTAYYENHDHGIYADGTAPGTNNLMVRNNVFYDIGHGWPIQLYPGSADGVNILNNTFAFPNPYRTGHIIIGQVMSNTNIENNLFYAPGGGAGIVLCNCGESFSSTLVANNLTTEAAILGSATPSGMTLSANRVNADAGLVDPASYDFHLQPGSPAVDTGASLSDVAFDADGCPRPLGAGWDIGAYESH